MDGWMNRWIEIMFSILETATAKSLDSIGKRDFSCSIYLHHRLTAPPPPPRFKCSDVAATTTTTTYDVVTAIASATLK